MAETVNMNVTGRPYQQRPISLGEGRAASDRRPNILLIISDEHNANVMGCAGDPVIQTPNMDSLATSGVLFNNCYSNCPICVPVRAAITAGKYVSRIGSWNNFSMLRPATRSIARVLNDAGYESFLTGKMHYDHSCRYGFKELWWNMNAEHRTGLGPPRRPADDIHAGAGNYPDFDTDFGIAESGTVMRQAQRTTNGAVDFLSNRDPADKPFFLLVGYEGPHHPSIIPQRYYDRYKGRVALPKIPPGHLENLPLNYKHLRTVSRAGTLSPQKLTYMRELYYGLTNFVDDEIGRTLAALRARPDFENTVIIYTSDHGEMEGEHGMLWKSAMYEESARVPLIVSNPKRWNGGQKRNGACGLLDVVRTITDLAQADVPLDWNGSSLAPWLADPNTKWKDLAVSEYYAQHIASGFSMLRTRQWKYVYHTSPDTNHGPERELYNLDTDPGEFTNLAALSEHQPLLKELHAMLVKEVGEEPESIEIRARADIAAGYNRPPGAPIEMNDKQYPEPQYQGDNLASELRSTLS